MRWEGVHQDSKVLDLGGQVRAQTALKDSCKEEQRAGRTRALEGGVETRLQRREGLGQRGGDTGTCISLGTSGLPVKQAQSTAEGRGAGGQRQEGKGPLERAVGARV